MTCQHCRHSTDPRILIDGLGTRWRMVTCKLTPAAVTKRADDKCGAWGSKA